MPWSARGISRRLVSPSGIALTYFVVGILYIYISDLVINRSTTDPRTLTDLQTYKGWAFVGVTSVLLYFLNAALFVRLGVTRSRLRETRENFRRLVELSHDGMWAVDLRGEVVEVNSRLVRILGVQKEELLGRGMDRYLHPETFATPPPGADDRSRVGHEPRVVRFERSTGETGWGIVSGISLLDTGGTPTGQVRVLTDITRAREAEEALRRSLAGERTLLNELDHRVRNNLASLLTLIDLTRQSARDVGEFAHLIRGRVGAMAATHSLLAESKFTNVDLTRLISVITEGEQERRLEREGPPVLLGPSQAGPLAMILQELWANSVKHGALGSPEGKALVRWDIHSGNGSVRVIHLTWRDQDGPPVQPPAREGFGLTLVRGLANSDLRGRFTADFAAAGATFTIEFPMHSPNHGSP